MGKQYGTMKFRTAKLCLNTFFKNPWRIVYFSQAVRQDFIFAGKNGDHHERVEGIIALGFWF